MMRLVVVLQYAIPVQALVATTIGHAVVVVDVATVEYGKAVGRRSVLNDHRTTTFGTLLIIGYLTPSSLHGHYLGVCVKVVGQLDFMCNCKHLLFDIVMPQHLNDRSMKIRYCLAEFDLVHNQHGIHIIYKGRSRAYLAN